jgi:PAS domain S-box-containing protein
MANILIVEDEYIVAWDIKETLNKLGHQTIDLVGSGEEAIRSARHHDPDLVLMDIRLNGQIDGIIAGHEIYHQLDIPVVYLSAHADEVTLKRATRTNPFGYIIKPFQAQSLQSTIQIALNRHQLETATQFSQAYLTKILASVGSGIIATDRYGAITLMNPIAAELTGWQELDAIGLEIDRVFHLIWESDGTVIENPSMRAMRSKQPIKSPKKCWLVAKNGDEIPIYDIATPLFDFAGDVVGSVVVFHDNTERVVSELEAWEKHAGEIHYLQSYFTTYLQQQIAQQQQSIDCIQVLNLVLKQAGTATSEDDMLRTTIDTLGKKIRADYAWVTVRDAQTATVIGDYASAAWNVSHRLLGKQIDLQNYRDFYQHLCQPASWIDPPAAILPDEYLELLTPTHKLLILPIVVADASGEIVTKLTIGEVGIITNDITTWTISQADLFVQIFSYAVQLFRQTHAKTPQPETVSKDGEWLDNIDEDMSLEIERADRQMRFSERLKQQQHDKFATEIEPIQLSDYREIVKAEWQTQFDLIDTLIEFESATSPIPYLTMSDLEFRQWIDLLGSKCQILAKRHHHNFTYQQTGSVPSPLLGNFPVVESIVLELLINVCHYIPVDREIVMSIDIQDNNLSFSFTNQVREISAALETTYLPVSTFSHDRLRQPGITQWRLELVAKLLAYLGGEIESDLRLDSTKLSFLVPI